MSRLRCSKLHLLLETNSILMCRQPTLKVKKMSLVFSSLSGATATGVDVGRQIGRIDSPCCLRSCCKRVTKQPALLTNLDFCFKLKGATFITAMAERRQDLLFGIISKTGSIHMHWQGLTAAVCWACENEFPPQPQTKYGLKSRVGEPRFGRAHAEPCVHSEYTCWGSGRKQRMF